VATGTGKQSQGAVPGAGVGGGAGYRVPGTARGGTGFGDNDGHREAELGGAGSDGDDRREGHDGAPVMVMAAHRKMSAT
jgi:hypothetical protein